MIRNFQARGKIQGDKFEEDAVWHLKHVGFKIDGVHVDLADAGVEADIVATNDDDISFYISCKGSYDGERPGLLRTDTLRKAIGEAFCLREKGYGPVLVLTSHLPEDGRAKTCLQIALASRLIFDVLTPQNHKRLTELCKMSESELRTDSDIRYQLFSQKPLMMLNGPPGWFGK